MLCNSLCRMVTEDKIEVGQSASAETSVQRCMGPKVCVYTCLHA